jgi:hypothetical protein
MLELVSFNLQTLVTYKNHTAHNTSNSVGKIISLYFECFLSGCLQCKSYLYTNYSITCPTSKYHTGSDLVNKEVTTPCLLVCHQKHIISLKIIPSQHKHCQDVTYQCEFLVSEIKQDKNLHAFFYLCSVKA